MLRLSQIICVMVTLNIASSANWYTKKQTDAGGCTTADVNVMNKAGPGDNDGNFAKILADCGGSSWSIFGGFDESKMAKCVQGKIPLTDTCAACFGGAGKYGYDNCKMPCLTKWCSSSCLDCGGEYKDTLLQCTGLQDGQIPAPTVCNSEDADGALGSCYAETPPAANAVWVDNSCAEQLVGGACIAKCTDGYQMREGSDDTFLCLKTQSFVPKATFACDKIESENNKDTWYVFGLTLDKINFKHFKLKDIAGWDLQTQLVFGGVLLMLFACSILACCKCCKTAWCCRSHFRLKRSSQASEAFDASLETVYDLYPEMWVTPDGDDNGVNGGGAIFVR